MGAEEGRGGDVVGWTAGVGKGGHCFVVCVWFGEGEVSERVSVWRLDEVQRVKIELDCLGVWVRA